MKRARSTLLIISIMMFTLCAFATETAFMGFDVTQQKMFVVVVSDGGIPLRADVQFTQSNDQGYIGNPEVLPNGDNELWGMADMSPIDPDRWTDIDIGQTNTIGANITVYDGDNPIETLQTSDELVVANLPAGGIGYTYNNPTCTPIMPDSIRRGQSFCAWVCHGTYQIPIVCEGIGYTPSLLQIYVNNGCDPDSTHCNDATCPKVDWRYFRSYKRVIDPPSCELYLVLTYCLGNPGCVCIYRTDFYLPVEVISGSFAAEAGNGSVNLRWATGAETGENKFIITRSDTRDGLYHTVYSVRAAGPSVTRHDYTWTDTDVENGHTYYYQLLTMDMDGSRRTHTYSDGSGNPIIVDGTPSSTIAANYNLAQNYPNPFNSQTTFNFSIPEASNVTLKVFDVLGREVGTVVNGYLRAGSHTFNWSAGGLPTGVYMYTLKSGSFSKTMKMLYLK